MFKKEHLRRLKVPALVLLAVESTLAAIVYIISFKLPPWYSIGFQLYGAALYILINVAMGEVFAFLLCWIIRTPKRQSNVGIWVCYMSCAAYAFLISLPELILLTQYILVLLVQ